MASKHFDTSQYLVNKATGIPFAILAILGFYDKASAQIPWHTVTPDLNQPAGTDPITGDPLIEVGVKTGNAPQEFIRLNVVLP